MFSRTVSVKIFGNNSKIVGIKKKLSTGPRIKVSEEVKWALDEKKPIVALESTIITHGMPYPDNVKCALEVEGIVRKQRAIPATVAIIAGEVKVGLSEDEIDTLGNTIRSKPVKTSRRDLSYVVSNKLNGGTTVSGTLLIAHKLGIPIFATGGIGGVHRGAERTFDVSADLTELGKSNVAVVSSGVKSILDIAKTLEYLETQGVFVATFGENNDFPAFYSRNSGNKATYSINTATKAAEIIKSNMELSMQSGMLFAVPIPEEYAIPNDIIDQVIEKALADITGKVQGKEITPYLLSKVAELTKGRSLESNIALIKNNARVAADIAVALSNLSSNSICEEDSSERRKDDSKGRPVS